MQWPFTAPPGLGLKDTHSTTSSRSPMVEMVEEEMVEEMVEDVVMADEARSFPISSSSTVAVSIASNAAGSIAATAAVTSTVAGASRLL